MHLRMLELFEWLVHEIRKLIMEKNLLNNNQRTKGTEENIQKHPSNVQTPSLWHSNIRASEFPNFIPFLFKVQFYKFTKVKLSIIKSMGFQV